MKYKRKARPTQSAKPSSPKKKVNWKLYGILLASTAAIFALYETANYFRFKYIIHIYAGSLMVLGLLFGYFNRGFSRGEITADMLPDEWDEAKKSEYAKKQNKSKKLAKKFLIPIIGILVTFAFDLVYLFYLEPILG